MKARGYVRLRRGILEHWDAMTIGQYAVFHLCLALQQQDGEEAGRIGPITSITRRAGKTKRATIYRRVAQLVDMGYLRNDDGGCLWVANTNGGKSRINISNCDKPISNCDKPISNCDKPISNCDALIKGSNKGFLIEGEERSAITADGRKILKTKVPPEVNGDWHWDESEKRIWADSETRQNLQNLWEEFGMERTVFLTAMESLNRRIATHLERIPLDAGLRLNNYLNRWQTNLESRFRQ
jgi:hypothetical protein